MIPNTTAAVIPTMGHGDFHIEDGLHSPGYPTIAKRNDEPAPHPRIYIGPRDGAQRSAVQKFDLFRIRRVTIVSAISNASRTPVGTQGNDNDMRAKEKEVPWFE